MLLEVFFNFVPPTTKMQALNKFTVEEAMPLMLYRNNQIFQVKSTF